MKQSKTPLNKQYDEVKAYCGTDNKKICAAFHIEQMLYMAGL
jgi:hypothetical protein